MNFAFSEAIASGIFSTESSITESIFEYAAQANTPALPGPPWRVWGRTAPEPGDSAAVSSEPMYTRPVELPPCARNSPIQPASAL